MGRDISAPERTSSQSPQQRDQSSPVLETVIESVHQPNIESVRAIVIDD
ncbi:MAG: hypothetical protein AAFN70_09545 [Planctomycetota bacterium]